jgi:hypothetical protein
MPGNPQQRSWRQVAQNGASSRELVHRFHGCAGHDVTAERTQVRGKGGRDALRTPARQHPSDNVRQRAEHQAESRRRPAVQRDHAVRRDPGKQRPGGLIDESSVDESIGRLKCLESESSERNRMTRPPQRAENRIFKPRPIIDQGGHQRVVGGRVRFQPRCGPIDGATHNGRCSVIERVGHHERWLDPFKAMLRQWQSAKKRRGDTQRMYGRAHIVHEAGNCQSR